MSGVSGKNSEYQEGSVVASPVGGALLYKDTGNTLRVPSVTDPLPVEVASLPLPTGAATEATLAALNAKVTVVNTNSIAGTVTANAGTGVFDVTPVTPIATDYLPVRLTDGTAFIASLAGQQYTDGAAVGSPIGTVALGYDGANVQAISTDASGNLNVNVVSGGSTPVLPSTSAVTSVAASVTVVTILAANASRLTGSKVYNDSNSPMYIKYGAGASTTSFTEKVSANAPANIDYSGIVTAVWDSATGSARVTELTA